MVIKTKNIPVAEGNSIGRRLKAIQESLAATSEVHRLFFLAIKEELGEKYKGISDVQKVRDFTGYTAEALGFSNEDVIEEIAMYQLRKMAAKQLFSELKNEERATRAIVCSGGSMRESLERVKNYSEVRGDKTPTIFVNELTDELDDLPFD